MTTKSRIVGFTGILVAATAMAAHPGHHPKKNANSSGFVITVTESNGSKTIDYTGRFVLYDRGHPDATGTITLRKEKSGMCDGFVRKFDPNDSTLTQNQTDRLVADTNALYNACEKGKKKF